jgi:hypothetical protein
MCKACKELNEEKNDIDIYGIHISGAGYYNYEMPIIHCPVCGTILDKYKDKTPDHIKRDYDELFCE